MKKTHLTITLRKKKFKSKILMKLTTIINSVAILIFLSSFGVLFHKIQTASLSNPFVNNTAALTHIETDS